MSHPLSFAALTDALASLLDAQYDPRQPGKTRYHLFSSLLLLGSERSENDSKQLLAFMMEGLELTPDTS